LLKVGCGAAYADIIYMSFGSKLPAAVVCSALLWMVPATYPTIFDPVG
jgi:hypothetical protein